MSGPPPTLLLAMATMLAVSAGVGVGLAKLLADRPRRFATAVAVVAAGLLVLHAVWLNGNPLMVRLVRSADAVVWGNWSPVFVALLAAGAWRTTAVRWQRWVVVVVLAAVCVGQAYAPLFGRVPPLRPSRVVEGVHRQTTLSTCSAAAAATLLGTMGVPTDEAEMAELCLTREGGTLQLGLYGGLRMKMPGARVEFLNGDLDALCVSPDPVIASLGIGRQGWNPLERRIGHSVVILGRDAEGRLDVADPMTGTRYPMTREQFDRVWAGEALRVVASLR